MSLTPHSRPLSLAGDFADSGADSQVNPALALRRIRQVADRAGSSKAHVVILITTLVFLFAQLLAHTDGYFALFTTMAILFGLYSVQIAGGAASAIGMLNLILLAKFLLIAIVLKVATGQPVDQNLGSPYATGLVMAIGFFGLLAGTAVQRSLPAPKSSLLPELTTARIYLALTIVFLVFGYGGYVIGVAPDLSGEGIQTGGALGIARNFALFKSYSIATALYYAWIRGKRFLTHPLVLGVLTLEMVFGVWSTAKLDAMEPLAFYLAVGVARYGLRDTRLWALVCSGVAYYSLIVYPYSQYIRSAGGREGTVSERVKAMTDVLWSQLTDPNFREYSTTQIDRGGVGYLGRESLEPFSRLAMVGQADKLIVATNETAFTGWETITWGFALLTPSFIYPDKPVVPTGNYLGQITGEADPQDHLSQFSHGVMANFYNAFAFRGVLFGSILFFGGLYYFIRLCFGDPRWSSSPIGSALWFLILVGSYEHNLVEESFAGIMSRLTMPLLLLIQYWAARGLTFFLPAQDSTNDS